MMNNPHVERLGRNPQSNTPLIASPGDRWRKLLLRKLKLPDTASDALAAFVAAAFLGGGLPMSSTGSQDDPFRHGLCALLSLPMDSSNEVLRDAFTEALQRDLLGSAPLYSQGDSHPFGASLA